MTIQFIWMNQFIRMVQFLGVNSNQSKDNLKAKRCQVLDTGTVSKYGLMVQSIEDIGKKIGLTVQVVFGMQMVINLKENSKMINQMVKVHILVKMEQFIKVCGLMMFSMGRDRLFGQTDQALLVTIARERKMEQEHIVGQKVTNIRVSGRII